MPSSGCENTHISLCHNVFFLQESNNPPNISPHLEPVSVTPAELMTGQTMQQQQQQPHQMNLHLLANPGDSLLLQHTLDHLIRWLYPSLRIFHVSERASSFRTSARACPMAGTWRSMA